MSIRDRVRTLVWLLPNSGPKKALLNRMGHQISRDAYVGACLVLRVDRFRVGAGARVGRFNVFKDLAAVDFGAGARMGRMNLISAHPVYSRLYPSGARLEVGPRAKITSRHSLDCSGGVRLGELASIAGRQTTVLTHSVDLGRDAQVAYPVDIGQRSFVGSNCLLLGGATLPPRSVLGAGAVLRGGEVDRPGLWAGVPATWRGPVDGRWFDRDHTSTTRLYVPETGHTHEDVI